MATVLFVSALMAKIIFLSLLLDFNLLSSLVGDRQDMNQLNSNCLKVLLKMLQFRWSLKLSLELLFNAQILLFNRQFSLYPKNVNLIARMEEFVSMVNVSAVRCTLAIPVMIKLYPLVHSAFCYFYLLLAQLLQVLLYCIKEINIFQK